MVKTYAMNKLLRNCEMCKVTSMHIDNFRQKSAVWVDFHRMSTTAASTSIQSSKILLSLAFVKTCP